MITATIPVLNNIKITDDLFKSIYANTVQPTEIILIDNGSTDRYYKLVKKYRRLNINYIRKETNEGVNSAWNDGIRLSSTPYVSVLNNDLILNKYFFQKIIEAMKHPKVGIVVPALAKKKGGVDRSKDVPLVLKALNKREGWAFTIRKEVTDKLNPIPEKLKTYCGDDYLFYHTRLLGYKTVRMVNNFVYHYGGATVWNVWKDGKTTRLMEKKYWKGIQGIKDESVSA